MFLLNFIEWVYKKLINWMFNFNVRTCFTQFPMITILTPSETGTVRIDTLVYITAMSALFLAFNAILSVVTNYHNINSIPII